MEIRLPWPPKELHPNARPHFMAKSRATKKARHWANIAAKEAGVPFIESGTIPLAITCHPKTRHAQDRDGMLSMCKAYLDGIADAWGVNDSEFDARVIIGEVRKGGSVVVTLG